MQPAPSRPGAFWAFSLKVYADPVVAGACLELQDGWGADVNVVLFVLWHGANHHRLEKRNVEIIDQRIEPWRRQVVRPLRAVRRAMKDAPEAWLQPETEHLRNDIKRRELEAERLQQTMLETAFPLGSIGECDARQATLATNVRSYADVLGEAIPDALIDRLCSAIAADI
ncbi:MAG: TIGR02444 family protein [Hyphomicrobiales bacterium]|nr:MAG: TIGR02444 family protein [Hyphomicrobiales bacterium]